MILKNTVDLIQNDLRYKVSRFYGNDFFGELYTFLSELTSQNSRSLPNDEY